MKTGRWDIFAVLLIGLVALFATSTTELAEGMDTSTLLNVRVRVDEVGKIVSLEEINFGDYDPTNPTPTNASGALSVRTTKGTTYKIYIGESGGGVRQLSDSGGSALDFELYADSEGDHPVGGGSSLSAEFYE